MEGGGVAVDGDRRGGGGVAVVEDPGRAQAGEGEKAPGLAQKSVEVRVEAGIVEFYGSITDERERTALQILAENAPGVKAVRDHLVWVEPVSGLVIPAVGSEPPDNC